MTKKQLFALYICYLVPYIVGNAALPFMPIYAARLGASSAITGYFLASSFAALAAGTMSAGWLSERFQNRKALVYVSLVGGILGWVGMALAPNLLWLTLSTAINWFAGGLLTALVLILTGLFAEPHERGTTFGILTTALALGAIIGGAYSGRVVEIWDYRGLFIINAMLFILPLIIALMLEDKPVRSKLKTEKRKSRGSVNQVFWFLFFGSILIYTANFASTMILPLMMNDFNFSPPEISSTVTIAGLFNLPIPFIVGWLSDRIGRKHLLGSTYGFGVLGLLIMIYSTLLWHFWMSRVMLGIVGTGFALGSALLTDISEPEELDTALSRFATTPWIGGVVGYALTGIAMEQVGMISTLWLGLFTALVAALLIFSIRLKSVTKIQV